jgi:hypothetical protein
MAFAFESQAKLYYLLTNCSNYKNAVRLILDNFGIVGFLFFGRIPVDSSHFSLHFDNILSPKAPKYFSLDVLNWRPTEECSVL